MRVMLTKTNGIYTTRTVRKTRRKTPLRIIALALALALSCAAAPAAFADSLSVWGAQTSFTSASFGGSEVDIDVLNITGDVGETMFVTVTHDGDVVVEFLPHKIGDVDDGASSAADIFSIVAPNDAAKLNADLQSGAYKVTAYSERKTSSQIYQGTLYGVWAELREAASADATDPDPDTDAATTTKLIGARVVDSAGAPAFTAPEVIYEGGKAYKLAAGQETAAAGPLTLTYEAFDDVGTVDGVIKYVDEKGNLISSTPIAAIAKDEPRKVDIPSAIESTDGKLYRTLTSQTTVTAINPGQTSFTIQCAPISDENARDAGHYLAIINMVDQDGGVIARDTVNVTGEFAYTAPEHIYKTHNAGEGKTQALSYNIKNAKDITHHLSAASDGAKVKDGTRTIEIAYELVDTLPLQQEVTFNLIDGQKRVGEKGRILSASPKTATVNADNPKAQPEATITANGKQYNLVGEPADYEYAYGSGEPPVVDAYYIPADYEAPGPYTVTINYVNYANKQTITSETFESSPESLHEIEFTAPAEFSEGGATYIRLAGQDEPIRHSYYSNIQTYTVYYRDSADELSSAVVIDRIRVVYRDVPGETTYVDGGTTDEGTTDQGTTATGATATGGTAAGGTATDGTATGTTTSPLQLAADGVYNVIGGAANGLITNQSGVDSNTERIEDSETALASGTSDGTTNAGREGGIGTSIITGVVGGIAIVVLFALLLLFARRRRNNKQGYRR